MFKKLYIIFLLFIVHFALAQNPEMAKKYFDQGELDKAAYEYKLLTDKFPYNDNYLFSLIKIYQSQSKFKEVEKLLKQKDYKRKPQYLVYLGYNYQLQKDSIKAEKYYRKAIKQVEKQNFKAYTVGNTFKQLYLLDKAAEVYEMVLKDGKNTGFYLQLALIYAEQNKPESMIRSFLNLLSKELKYESQVKYYLTRFITQDPENEINVILKNQLINRIKDTQDTRWYRLLQWLYTQQKEYKKAFLQLKSLYKKEAADIAEIYHLAKTAVYNKKIDDAKSIYHYVIRQNDDPEYVELSKLALLQLDLKSLLNEIQKQDIETLFQTYLTENWLPDNKIALQIAYADFLAFHLGKTDEALELLSGLEQQHLNKQHLADLRLKKADILLYNEKFNQALILYTQVQLDFPNNPLGHKATYDIARASFFQGDIDWAHGQLKVIKSVADDLIANDAIDLDLLIINNKEEGDSIHTGLKQLARAKYEIYRKNASKAIQHLDNTKQQFKGQLIYDDALLIQAGLYEQRENYQKALENYQAILDNNTEDLLKDDALFRMAMIYEKLDEVEKAKNLFKIIVIEYPASYWFVDARKHFRRLRGDDMDSL